MAYGQQLDANCNLCRKQTVESKQGSSWLAASCLRHSSGVSAPVPRSTMAAHPTIGFPFSYGVYKSCYSRHDPFVSKPIGITAIGTTQAGIMYFGCPVIALLCQRWPQLRRSGTCLGAAVMVVSLIAASFCNSVSGLLATQGVMYGLGGMVLYYPTTSFISEWFVLRKGLAYGIMWAGTGSAGVVAPFLLQWLHKDCGFRTSLRAWAVILVCTSPICSTELPLR